MDDFYAPAARKLLAWAENNPDVAGVVILGSQARRESPGDRWSDLDLLVFADAPSRLIESDDWLCAFGRPVCITREKIPLDSMSAVWYVTRPLYDDFRALDISIVASGRMEEFLTVNAELHSHGYEVLYDRDRPALERKILESIRAAASPGLPEVKEADFRYLVSDLLYHVIWAFKKIKRGELWTAVSCVNCYMKGNLLQLIEMHNAAGARRATELMFDGRLLESRIDPRVRDTLRACFARYDEADAADALGGLMDAIELIARDISASTGFGLDEGMFEDIRAMYGKMIGWRSNG